MNIEAAQLSDRGPRPNNEDAVLVRLFPQGALLAIADGLGGHFDGDQASKIALVHIENALLSGDLSQEFKNAHDSIRSLQGEKSTKGMATTATAVLITDGLLIGAHCGDTRCIIQRGNGIKKLTTDQTEAHRLFAAGKLTKKEYLNYPRRNILDSALGGGREPQIDTFQFSLEKGDKIILTSDGIHEKILLRRIYEIIHQAETAQDIVNLIESELQNIGPDDNYSIVAATIG